LLEQLEKCARASNSTEHTGRTPKHLHSWKPQHILHILEK